MKRFLVGMAFAGLLTLGLTNIVLAQDTTPADQATPTTEAVADQTPAPASAQEQPAMMDEPAEEVPMVADNGGFHQVLKTKFIEGGFEFMAAIAFVLILGLGLCLERIIYLNLADTNNSKFLKAIQEKLDKNDTKGALDLARDTRGPVASITYQALLRIDQSIDVVERSITAYGGVQAGLLEKNLSWITLFIAIAPSLGFLGTVIGMVVSFDTIEQVGDISPTVVAGGMKIALITTIFGLIVAMILQIFYNYILAKYESILNNMEDASISLIDYVVDYNVKYKNLK